MTLNEKLQNLETHLAENYDFWKSDAQETLMEVGEKLFRKGFTLDEAIDIISTVWNQCAEEYGE